MVSEDTRRVQVNGTYQATPEVISSGFLTPTLPYEGRRDSVASSQSSYCQSFSSSDYSGTNDFSLPVTPTCERSPLAHDGFVDVSSYVGAGHALDNQPMHGLPLVSQTKQMAHSEGFDFESMMGQYGLQSVPGSTPAFQSHMIATSRAFGPSLHPHIDEHTINDNVSPGEAAWGSASMITWPDRHAYHFIDRHARRCGQLDSHTPEDVQALWDSTILSSFDQLRTTSAETMVPSDAIMEGYALIPSDEFGDTSGITHPELAFPHTPEEVSFKKEESPAIKEESEFSESAGRMEGRMYIRSTGAKGVKKERRASTVSKKKSRVLRHDSASPKPKRYPVTIGGHSFEVDYKGIVPDHNGGFRRVNGIKPKKQWCEYTLPGGQKCPKGFERIEHLRRHEKTHRGEIDARCNICSKGFGRNDNCIAHYDTHVMKVGKKPGRNIKLSLREVVERAGDKKIGEKLLQKFAAEAEMELTI